MKTKFFVRDENTFCCVNPRQPHVAQILSSKAQLGGVAWMEGTIIYDGCSRWRPATREDFSSFRVNYEQYAKHPEDYEMP